MKASGAWSGANVSSGFDQALKNVATDGANTIARLQRSADNAHQDSLNFINRTTAEYDQSIGNAKKDLDTSIESLKHDMGLQLTGLTEKYGTGNKTLTDALDKIQEEFGLKSQEAYSKFISNIKAIDDNTKQNIDNIDALNTLKTKLADKRYNEYLSNNGALLLNASLPNLAKEVESGSMSQQRYADLRNIMMNSISQSLSKLGKVDQADIDTANHLLDMGKTPTEVIAKIGEQAKFKTQEKLVSVGTSSNLYDPNTGKWITPPTTTTTTGAGVNATGADLYKKMTASTNPIGVYATGDMDGSRHAAIYNTAVSEGLDNFINKYQGTKITSDMVNKSAQKYGVDPLMIAATMALDSSMGTAGKGARNNNPGNIGQFDSLDAQGITVK